MSKLTEFLLDQCVEKQEGSIEIPTHVLLAVATFLEQALAALSSGDVETAKQCIEEAEHGIFQQVIALPDPRSQQTMGFEIVNGSEDPRIALPRKFEELIANLNAGKPIPAVDPADFKTIWRMRDTTGGQKAMTFEVFQTLGLRSTDDLHIISFRSMLLQMLLSTGTLKPFEPDSKAEDAALNVAATFPVVFTDPKKPDATLFDSFDVGAFVREVQDSANL